MNPERVWPGAEHRRARIERRRSAGFRGFTLVELLVALAIISLLVSILLPTLGKARKEVYKTRCASNQRQIGLGMAAYGNQTSGNCARFNQGRTNGTWTGEYASVANDRPVGLPAPGDVGYPSPMHLGIYGHGSWLIHGLTKPSVYFCPGLSFERRGPGSGGVQARVQLMEQWRNYWETAGMQGPAPGRAATNQTSYHINRSVTTNIWWHGYTTDFRRSGGWKYEQLRSGFPMLSDWRGTAGGGNIYAYHDSSGFNIMRADGSVQFFRSERIIRAGASSAMPTALWRNYFQNWISYRDAVLPEDPSTDSAVNGGMIPGVDPMTTNNDAFFEGVWQAIRGN